MKNKKFFYIIMGAANAVSIAAAIILSVCGNSLAHSQRYNYAAELWDENGGYSQISCFFSDDAGFTTDSVGGVKVNVQEKLKNVSVFPEENKKLIPESYSVSAGQATVKSDTTLGKSEADITAVGGDFFMFRGFRLLDGSYFSESDIMQDGAVIDRSLAWALYGSYAVSGMNIYINGVKFYISGVIDNPSTEPEKKTAGELPRAYISYEGAGLIGLGEDMKKITCYECLVPNPVENYAYNAVNDYFSGYKDDCVIIDNTRRFNPSVRAKEFKNLSEYAVVNNHVIYPYWENASRIVEFKLTSVYFYRYITYVIPIITVLYIIGVLWGFLTRFRRISAEWISDKITRILYNRSERKRIEKEKN